MQLDGEEEQPYSPVCTYCRHLLDFGAGRRCAAFPDGIPPQIWHGENNHRRPYPGDHGIRFEVLTPAEIDQRIDQQEHAQP